MTKILTFLRQKWDFKVILMWYENIIEFIKHIAKKR